MDLLSECETVYSSRESKLKISFRAVLPPPAMTPKIIRRCGAKPLWNYCWAKKDFQCSLILICVISLFHANEQFASSSNAFFILERMNTSLIKPENINDTVLVSENEIERFEFNNIKTESTDQHSRDNLKMASPNSTEETSQSEKEHSSCAATKFGQGKNEQLARFRTSSSGNLL